MNLPAHAPDLDAPASGWQDYLNTLSDEQIIDVRGMVVQFGIKNPFQAEFVESLLAMIEANIVARFIKIVPRVTYLEGALFLAQRDLRNTQHVVELLEAGGFVTQEKVNEAVSIIVTSEAKLAKEVA